MADNALLDKLHFQDRLINAVMQLERIRKGDLYKKWFKRNRMSYVALGQIELHLDQAAEEIAEARKLLKTRLVKNA